MRTKDLAQMFLLGSPEVFPLLIPGPVSFEKSTIHTTLKKKVCKATCDISAVEYPIATFSGPNAGDVIAKRAMIAEKYLL